MRTLGRIKDEYLTVLTPEALVFIAELEHRFGEKRMELLEERKKVQSRIDAGARPDFPRATKHIREDKSWHVLFPPRDLEKRLVEITGPAGDRKMVINAFNSGADVFMADFEDAQSPTWDGLMTGQLNLYDAVRRTISFDHPKKGKIGLVKDPATLMVRPRGWHLSERHLLVDDEPISASLFDFGLFIFHNGKELVERGSGPYFYLPKLESYEEAVLWNDIFAVTEQTIRLPRGSIKATVLIENILATFMAEEILWALRDRSAGLNVGRWDYIASFGKKFRRDPTCVLPDRGLITMESPFLKAYVEHVIAVCHKRGAYAIGGMAAQVPIPNDTEANERAMQKVRADKEREVRAGHDGTWVAHPALVPVAREIFEAHLGSRSNQLNVRRDEYCVSADAILEIPKGPITREGLRENVNAFVEYVASWLRGVGAAAIAYRKCDGTLYAYLMEDAATAEIARTEVWKWLKEGAVLSDGTLIDEALVRTRLQEELAAIRARVGEAAYKDGLYEEAATLFLEIVTAKEFPDYLTLSAYEKLLTLKPKGGEGHD